MVVDLRPFQGGTANFAWRVNSASRDSYEGTAIIQGQQFWMPEVGFGFVEIDEPREGGIFSVVSTAVWRAETSPVAVTVVGAGDGANVASAK